MKAFAEGKIKVTEILKFLLGVLEDILGKGENAGFQNKIKVIEKLKFLLGVVEDIVGKEENAGYQHFLLFKQCLQKAAFHRSLTVGIM